MKNTKNILFSLILILLCAFLGYNLWKNSRSSSGEQSAKGADNDFSNTPVDTLYGYKGCERAGMYTFPSGERQFVYQNYNIRVGKPLQDSIRGEKITVTPIVGGVAWDVVLPNDSYFGGFYREHMLVNVGADPAIREVLFVDVKDKLASYQSFVVDTPSVISGKFWFYAPIEESEVREIPDCPKKSEWEQKGLKTAYAQLCLYDFSNGSVTRKSEYKCYGKK
ncbi:MAG: hypothetical protein IT270_15590 [Saprospiraceae bacterium]|nr:hypothetical protein [Saprospiraceae bacterium]